MTQNNKSNKNENEITKDNINTLLNAFAKEYKKHCNNIPIELLIVGGGSVIINYDFRASSKDIDIYVNNKPNGFREAVIKVSDKFDMPDDWLNDDFMILNSCSKRLPEISTFYRSLNNGAINVRTVKGKYLIAMKMQSGREYSNDIPDIIGILKDEKAKGNEIKFEDILESGKYLYGDNFKVSEILLQEVQKYCNLNSEELEQIYNERIKLSGKIFEIISNDKNINRTNAKKLAIKIKEDITNDKLEEIIQNLKSDSEQDSFLFLEKYVENLKEANIPKSEIIRLIKENGKKILSGEILVNNKGEIIKQDKIDKEKHQL